MQNAWQGTGLKARLIRSSGWVSSGYLASQVFRLFSNLILTRVLFPEAFGLMALITAFMIGLAMLSDIGVGPSIQQSAKGDDPAFIDTAWTIQAVRGGLLWLLCWPIGIFAAWFYDDGRLETMLPVAGLSLLVSGFNPTRIETASRHLALGRVTLIDLVAQIISLILLISLALMMENVWALVIGGVFASVIRLVLMDHFLPGPRNRFCWSPAEASDLIHFGKWIFLSTLCGFVLLQGDKAILGKYFSMETLGIYNIGYFIAGFPQALATTIMGKVMIPLYRVCPPGASAANYAKLQKPRAAITFLVLAMQFTLAFSGVWIINFLYDDRFAGSGPVVVAVACMGVPNLIGMTYDYAAIAQGNSRGQFYLRLARAIMQTLLFILGMEYYGLAGALVGWWLSQILAHMVVIGLARRHGAWDPWHDLCYAVIGLILTVAVLYYHWEALSVLNMLVQ